MNTRKEINELGTLFKYFSDSKDVIQGLFIDKRIRFTQPAALNDPLEFNPSIRFDDAGNNYRKFEYRGVLLPSIHDWYCLNLIESRINNYGILSLTDNPYSFEMWSHYANGHKGFLLEFNIADKSKPELEIERGKHLRIHKVKYVRDYSINIDQLKQGKKTIPFNSIRDEIFLRKTSHWKCEREYRIIRELNRCENFKLPNPKTSYRDNNIYLFPIDKQCISSVIFGINTSREIKSRIIDLCQGSKVNFLQAIMLKDKQNKMEFVSIDSFGNVDNYLKLLPQLFTTDSVIADHKQPIAITSLKEMPFYHLQSNDFDEYVKKRLTD